MDSDTHNRHSDFGAAQTLFFTSLTTIYEEAGEFLKENYFSSFDASTTRVSSTAINELLVGPAKALDLGIDWFDDRLPGKVG